MGEDTGMPSRPDTGPLRPMTRGRRVVAAGRAILRPRNATLSWGAGRLLAGAILVCGVIAQALFGWRWWIVVIVLTAGGEALLVGTTLARSAEREELVDELLDALSPGRARTRRAYRAVERFRAAPFPLYGLPGSWTGPRSLAGWATSRPRHARERTTQVQLAHGDRRDAQGSFLLVEIDAEHWPRHGSPAHDLADRLTHLAGPGAGGYEAGAPGAPADQGAPREVRRVEIPVDGAAVGFDVLGDGRGWVAQGEIGDLVVTLEARDLPLGSVRLARLDDLGPYLTGAEA
jgi:hypothetical protein